MGTRQSGKRCHQLFVYIFEKVWFGSLGKPLFVSWNVHLHLPLLFSSQRQCKKWPLILFAGTRIRDWVWGPTISAGSTCTLSFLWPGVRHYQDVPLASLAWRPRWSLCAKRRGDHVEKSWKIFYKNVSSHCAQSVPILRKTNIRKYLLIFATIFLRPGSNLFIAFFSESGLTFEIVKVFEISLHFCT